MIEGYHLNQFCIIPGIIWRYGLYGASRVAGTLWRFSTTGWRPTALWLLFSILLVAAVALAMTAPTEGDIAPSTIAATNTSSPAVINDTLETIAIDAGNLSGSADAIRNESILNASAGAIRNASAGAIANITATAVDGARSFAALMTTEAWGVAFAIFAFGVFIQSGLRTRRQLAIGSFSDNVGDEAGKFPGGAGAYLANELLRLKALYSQVDDRRPITSFGRESAQSIGRESAQLEYAIQTGDSGMKIENAFEKTDKIQIGGLVSIPIGAFAGVLSRLFAGPQIAGSLHRDGDRVVLNAFMTGPQNKSWRVEGSTEERSATHLDRGVKPLRVSSGGEPIPLELPDKKIVNLDAMLMELAYRIITDLSPGGTVRWQATAHFTEGLREYRSCLLSPKDRLKNLRNAERRFLDAIGEDSTFDLAWYNLGVVYTELNNLKAAEQAFLKAIETSPRRWEPYYALSLNRFNRMRQQIQPGGGVIGLDDPGLKDIEVSKIQDIIQPCKAAIEIKPNPQIDILAGVCYRLLAVKFRNRAREATDEDSRERSLQRSQRFFRLAARHHRIAVQTSWHALCAFQFRRADDAILRASDVRRVSSTALWDDVRTHFAYLRCHRDHEDRAADGSRALSSYAPLSWLLAQAVFIDRTNAAIVAELGRIAFSRQRYEDAGFSFQAATQIEPTNLTYWAQLAVCCEQIRRKGGWKWQNMRELAADKVLACPSSMKTALSERWKCQLCSLIKDPSDLRDGDRIRDLLYIHLFQEECCAGGSACAEGRDREENSFVTLTAALQKVKTDTKYVEDVRRWWTAQQLYHSAVRQRAIADGPATDGVDTEKAGKPIDTARREQAKQDAVQQCSQALETLEGVRGGVVANWARGIIAFERACCTGRSEDYLASYRCLKELHPLEVEQKEIDIRLIDALLAEEKFNHAFEIAATAHRANPLGFGENLVLGRCLFAAKDYVKALTSFESALLRKPFDVQTLRFIGYCYWELGYYCLERTEKEAFWRDAIHSFEGARAVLAVDEGTGGTPDQWTKDDQHRFEIACDLGDCYSGISEYGRALSNYEIAHVISQKAPEPRSSQMLLHCRLKCAEALLHKRDHCRCEVHFSEIIDTIHRSQGETAICSSHRPIEGLALDAPIAGRRMLRRISEVGEMAEGSYVGDMYIKALIGKAYSLAIRDTGLGDARELLRQATSILDQMEKSLKRTRSFRSPTHPKGLSREEIEAASRLDAFLGQGAVILRAEIADKTGWIEFKDYSQPDNLTKAEGEINKAISLWPDPEYFYHRAHICLTMAREKEKDRDLNLRRALAACDHALDMIPRRSLERDVQRLASQVFAYAAPLNLGKGLEQAYAHMAESPKPNTG